MSDHIQTFLTAFCFKYLYPILFEQIMDHFPIDCIIIYDQNLCIRCIKSGFMHMITDLFDTLLEITDNVLVYHLLTQVKGKL